MHRRLSLCALILALIVPFAGAATDQPAPTTDPATMHAFVDHLLSRMTLEEKVGQLSIAGADRKDLEQLVREGRLGGTNGVLPGQDVLAHTRRMQQLAMQSRLKIPLWFMGDVNHGFRTIFPVPLALAASWDTELVERVHRAAAAEATAAGVDWTFSPMVDISRDPRWGRVVEGAGEDPFLGAAMARAQLRGFQGDDLAAPDTMLATAKHFVGYGAVEGGRDYNATWLPQDQLHDVYLPPFQALVDGGIGAVMPALTTLNGIPSTADGALLNGLLRQRWGFDGVIVSDFDAVPELQLHGIAASPADAARLALAAGIDIDLHSGTYLAEAAGAGAQRRRADGADRRRRASRAGGEVSAGPVPEPVPLRRCAALAAGDLVARASRAGTPGRHRVDGVAEERRADPAAARRPAHRGDRSAGRRAPRDAGADERRGRTAGCGDDPRRHPRGRRQGRRGELRPRRCRHRR
ncbi:Beta-hexosaminidase [Rhodanobacter lindaniclasticus]